MNKKIQNLILNTAMVSMIFLSVSCKKESNNENSNTNTSTKSFCYSFSNSNATYDTLVGAKEAVLNSINIYDIPLGFNFNYCGKTFSNVYFMMGSLSASFSYSTSDGFVDLSGYELLTDGTLDIDFSYDSKMFYKTTGSAGNRITTIEFRNYYYNSSSVYVNLQIKLFENGSKIEYHYGPNNMTDVFSNSELIVGMYSGNLNNGIYLYGTANNPTSTYSYNGKAISKWPENGTVYKFF